MTSPQKTPGPKLRQNKSKNNNFKPYVSYSQIVNEEEDPFIKTQRGLQM